MNDKLIAIAGAFEGTIKVLEGMDKFAHVMIKKAIPEVTNGKPPHNFITEECIKRKKNGTYTSVSDVLNEMWKEPKLVIDLKVLKEIGVEFLNKDILFEGK